MEKLLHSDITDKILLSFFTVCKDLTKRFPKEFFKNALAIEFKYNGLQIDTDNLIELKYRNQKIGEIPCDFLVNKLVMIKLINEPTINNQIEEETKLLLKNSRIEICLILNIFGDNDFKCLVYTNDYKKHDKL